METGAGAHIQKQLINCRPSTPSTQITRDWMSDMLDGEVALTKTAEDAKDAK